MNRLIEKVPDCICGAENILQINVTFDEFNLFVHFPAEILHYGHFKSTENLVFTVINYKWFSI